PGGNAFGDETFRVHACEARAGEATAMTMEVPVRDAVLHRHDRGALAKKQPDLPGDAGHLVRLEREDHDVVHARGGVIVERPNVARDLRLAVGSDERDAAAADRLDVCAAHQERDFLARERELGADITADGTGTDDCDLHLHLLVRSGPRKGYVARSIMDSETF